MRTISPLEKLPDLRSFISASPIFLQWYLAYRQPVLKPITELLKAAYHGDASFNPDAIRGVQLRLQAHRFPYLDPDEIEGRVYRVAVSKSLTEKEWSGSLPFLCELFEQRQDADTLISEYAAYAWDNILGEARLRSQRDPSFTWLPEFDQPLVLAPSEIIRFEEGFLAYDYHRHDIYHDMGILDGYLRPGISDLESLSEIRWCLPQFQSVFYFVYVKYRELMHRVDWEIRGRGALNGSLSRERDTRVCQFLGRTKYQEHRCVVFLSIQGYTLLRNLRRMDQAHVRHFIMNTFLWVMLRDAKGYLPPEERFLRDIQRHELLIESPLEPMYEPWTRARYFWGGARVAKIYGNQR
ncbi:hypothetical protein FNAPI_8786 [Fusarium napiforme]|uniref:Uncharacterized protein n=1 Tax=Fusarium napiforme TaxID=42672 RepID=A0A8H5J0I3_9HYPO|nr:hypothetical protein FNAPI_8786 [Fusarium napiforme]